VRTTPAQKGILAAAAALAIALFISFRRVPHASSQPAPPAAALVAPEGSGHATTVLSGFDYAETSSGRPKFRVHADRTVGFAQGAGLPSTWYGLEAVSLTLFTDEGEPFEVKSDRADYDPRTKAMHLMGNVRMTDASGTNLRTAKVDYDPSRNMVLVPEPIEMLRGGIRSHASSAVYDAVSRELALAGPVTAEGTAGLPGAPSSPFSSLRSDRGLYRRTAGEIDLMGHVEGARGIDRFTSDSLRLHVTAANQIDRATAEGSVSGSVANTPGQPPQLFSATRASLDFSAAGKLERIVLSGGARMERDGRNAKGEAVRETIQSDSADALFAAAGTIDSARFIGNVVATSPEAIAHAPSAVYAASENRLTFLAEADRDAEVLQPRGKVVARRIDLLSGSSRLIAIGSARAFLKPSSENRGLPEFLSSSKKPTRAKAERIELDNAARTASFVGGVAIWQEANALFGDKVEMFDENRSASADGHVRAVAHSAAAPGESKAPPLTTITAERMRYQDSSRTARFESQVLATRGEQAAHGDAAESRFNAKNQVERTVLSGHVKFSDPATGRSGIGDRAEDEPLAGVTTLYGDPAVAQDARGNRITAAVLTFRKDSGSVEAKAKDGQKIESIYQTKGQSHGRPRGRMN
jgi:LPS export ABC transporter protein LptC